LHRFVNLFGPPPFIRMRGGSIQEIAQGTTMDTQRADDVRAQTVSPHKLNQMIEMAVRLDHAFALVDEALAQDPKAQELRAALDRVPVRGLCRLVSVARGT
jgi:hypothetical protein